MQQKNREIDPQTRFLIDVGWGPTRMGGYISQSHAHEITTSDSFLIRPTLRISLWWYIFYSIAVVVNFGAIPFIGENSPQMIWFFLGLSVFFGLTGLYMQKLNGYSYCFDRDTNSYARGKSVGLSGTAGGFSDKSSGSISDIFGLQFINKRGGDRYGYTIGELNIILEDGSRFLLMTHADDRRFYETMNDLARYLDKPIYLAPYTKVMEVEYTEE